MPVNNKPPENLLFVLPDTGEEAIWSLPVVSQYLENRVVMVEERVDKGSGFRIPARAPVGKVSIVCKLEELHNFARSCWSKVNITTSITKEQVEEADIVFVFNPQLAYELSIATKKHITDAFGITMGAVPVQILPAIAQRVVRPEPGLLVVVRRQFFDQPKPWVWEFEEEFVKSGLAGEIPIRVVPETASYDELSKEVSRASVVVGVRSTGTLLASCYRKVVMELSPDDGDHKEWMSKWENKRYRMIYGDLHDMEAWFVWDRTNKLLAELSKARGQNLWECLPLTTSQEVSEIVVG